MTMKESKEKYTSITQIANKPNRTHQHTWALAAKTQHVCQAHAHNSYSHVTVTSYWMWLPKVLAESSFEHCWGDLPLVNPVNIMGSGSVIFTMRHSYASAVLAERPI